MSRTNTKSRALVSICMIALALSTKAQTLDGFVRDEATGASLEGAVVTVPELGLKANTNRRGYFSFDDLAAGTYAVQVSYFGAGTKTTEATVSEGTSSTLDVRMKSEVYELEEFSVSSYQSATNRALNLQRSSENLRDIVASDHFGQFADTNAAEALNRLPGVSIDRDQGEGRFVVIRGIDPNLNSIAIDGVALAAPSGSERSALLDTIPIEVLDTLEVTKAVLPSQPGDSIGGHINLRTPSAFDQEARVTNLDVAYLYSDLVDEGGHRVNAAFADTFGKNDQWGLYLTAVNSERTFGSDNVEADPFTEEDGLATPEFQYREYDLERERTGVSANLEFQANPDSLFFFRTSYNNYKDTEIRQRSNSKFEGAFTASGNSFTNDEVESELELKEREENMRIWVASIGGEQSFGEWTVDYTLSFSQAEEDTPFDYEAVYAADGTSVAQLTGTNSYTPRLGLPLGGLDYTDASLFEYDELTLGEQIVEETDLSAQANFKRDFDEERLQYIKFGGLVRSKEKDSDFTEKVLADETGFETADAFLSNGARNPFGRPIPFIGTGIFNQADGAGFTQDGEREFNSQIEDYESEEDVLAAYLMASFDIGEWNLIAGARVEHTEFETRGFEGDEENELITGRTSFDKSYTNLLPGIHLRRELTEDLIFRASWTNTIARPTFGQSNPAVIEGDVGEFTLGNPELDPYEAMNFDASLQFYSEDYGTFGVAVFYKDIENFIYDRVLTGAAADAIISGATQIERPENGDSGEILGLELSYFKQLDFLPGPLAGLSVSSNLTLSDSEADAERPGGAGLDTTPFIKQSDIIGNLSIAWEWERIFIRLSGNYRDDYLDELGENEFEDRYIDDFFQMDLYSSVRVTDNVTAFLEVNNLTNEPFRAYWKGSGRLSQFEEYGVSGAVGLRASF